MNNNKHINRASSASDVDFNQRESESLNEREEEKSEYTYEDEEVSEYYSESQPPDTQRN